MLKNLKVLEYEISGLAFRICCIFVQWKMWPCFLLWKIGSVGLFARWSIIVHHRLIQPNLQMSFHKSNWAKPVGSDLQTSFLGKVMGIVFEKNTFSFIELILAVYYIISELGSIDSHTCSHYFYRVQLPCRIMKTPLKTRFRLTSCSALPFLGFSAIYPTRVK